MVIVCMSQTNSKCTQAYPRYLAWPYAVPTGGEHCCFCFPWLQVNIVGKAESDYLAGVQVPQVIAESAAERAGIKPGDLILRVGNYQVTASPDQVRRAPLIEELAWACLTAACIMYVSCVSVLCLVPP